jgi:hypothetical protein
MYGIILQIRNATSLHKFLDEAVRPLHYANGALLFAWKWGNFQLGKRVCVCLVKTLPLEWVCVRVQDQRNSKIKQCY